MSVESATYVSQLDGTNPPGTATIAEGDNHLRLIKTVVKTTFPDATAIRRTAPDVSGADALKVLRVNAGGSATEWAASAGSPLTTKGDLYTYSTADARLAAPTTTPAGTDVYDVNKIGLLAAIDRIRRSQREFGVT